MNKTILLCGSVFLVLAVYFINSRYHKQENSSCICRVAHKNHNMEKYHLYNDMIDNPYSLFIKSTDDIIRLKEKFYHDVAQAQEEILACEITDKTLLYIYDRLMAVNLYCESLLQGYLLMGSDMTLKQHIQELMQEKSIYMLEQIYLNDTLFHHIKKSYDYFMSDDHKNELSESEKRYFDDIYYKFKIQGAELQHEDRELFKELSKKLISLSNQIQMNISTCKNGFYATKEELDGVPEHFIETLKKDDNDKYWVDVSYPANENIMKYCTNRETREKQYNAFANRGYPDNVPLFEEFFKTSQKIARLLGYKNAAEAEITPQNTMAQSITTVEEFLAKINDATREKTEKELDMLKIFGKEHFGYETMMPWDLNYVTYEYKKKILNFDAKEITYYLPVNYCIDKLLEIYQTFFNVTFKITPYYPNDTSLSWDFTLKIVDVYDKDNIFLGSVTLDLHPRDNKYTHACIESCTAPFYNNINGTCPAACFMIANFTKSNGKDEPLMTFRELNTFFHEFGHAMHFILEKGEFAGQCAFELPRDFVELPSQMFEQWLKNPEILKMVSKHYKTGEPLPDDLIDKIIADKKFMIGNYFQTQLCYSLISLYSFIDEDLSYNDIAKKYTKKIVTLNYDAINFNDYYSFTHLTGGYGPKYYGYIWTLAYALDLAEYVKEHNGFLDPKIGQKFAEKIFSKGASMDCKEALESFIERPLSLDALHRYVSGK